MPARLRIVRNSTTTGTGGISLVLIYGAALVAAVANPLTKRRGLPGLEAKCVGAVVLGAGVWRSGTRQGSSARLSSLQFVVSLSLVQSQVERK